jgi:CRISPR-associated protein Csy2
MRTLPDSEALLIVPRLKIQNANAISSPFTHGFPSITAFLGVMWALERRLAGGFPLGFDSVGVICHRHDELVNDSGFLKTFRLTRNPIDKDGSTAAIVEEGRIHLEISLVFGVSGGMVSQDPATQAQCAQAVAHTLSTMRIAGGSVLPSTAPGAILTPRFCVIPENRSEQGPWFRRLRRRLLPGFALIGRDDLLAQRLEALRRIEPETTPLDAWLDLSRFNWRPVSEDGNASEKVRWQHDHPEGSGWLVPIPVGYGALSQRYRPGDVAHARDFETPFRFVESLYSIGQWMGPHRLDDYRALLWYSHTDEASGLYRACNDAPSFCFS